jgi:hypothetical protein
LPIAFPAVVALTSTFADAAFLRVDFLVWRFLGVTLPPLASSVGVFFFGMIPKALIISDVVEEIHFQTR